MCHNTRGTVTHCCYCIAVICTCTWICLKYMSCHIFITVITGRVHYLHNVTTMSKNKLVCHLTKNGLNYYQSWWKLPDVLKKAFTAQKMKFSIKDFFSKCNQIRSFLRIWSHLLKKSLMKNFIFSAVFVSEQLQKYFRLQVVS